MAFFDSNTFFFNEKHILLRYNVILINGTNKLDIYIFL